MGQLESHYMKPELDDVALQVMLNNTQYQKPADTTEHWYSFQNQKQLTFHLAANLFVVNDMDADEAITEASAFINTFYQRVMNPRAFK